MSASNVVRSVVRVVIGIPLWLLVEAYYRLRKKRQDPLPTVSVAAQTPNSPTIDVVYTWVNDQDETWARQKATCAGDARLPSAHMSRFHDREELRYSLRSLAAHAPFVNQIHIVTNGQVPAWLNTDHPRVNLVTHEQIFADPSNLPTFNSHAIEAQLHHIPGLAEHYLYFNDDVFLGQPVLPADFFNRDGQIIFYCDYGFIEDVEIDVERHSAVEWAARNNLRVLKEELGRRYLYKLKHQPHALRKSILYEIEDRFPSVMKQTAAHRFRHPSDHSVVTSFAQFYAESTDQAEMHMVLHPGFPSFYINLASPFLRAALARLRLSRAYKSFCINEPVSADLDTSRFDRTVSRFLDRYFPYACEYER